MRPRVRLTESERTQDFEEREHALERFRSNLLASKVMGEGAIKRDKGLTLLVQDFWLFAIRRVYALAARCGQLSRC